MAINKATVTTSSSVVYDGENFGTDVTFSGDPNGATVWLASGVPAVVGEGVRLDLFAPKHTFWGVRNEPIYAIAESGSVVIGIHMG